MNDIVDRPLRVRSSLKRTSVIAKPNGLRPLLTDNSLDQDLEQPIPYEKPKKVLFSIDDRILSPKASDLLYSNSILDHDQRNSDLEQIDTLYVEI